jgi:hypothetical protein
MSEYTHKDAFRDGFNQCLAQVVDMFSNPALDTRAKMKEYLASLKPFDEPKIENNETGNEG